MKVSNLHESATALDMIRGRTKSIQCKNVPVAKFQLQIIRANDLQVGNAVGHLFLTRKIPNALSKSVLTTYYVIIRRRRPILLSQLTCEPIRSMIVVKSVLKHKTPENCLWVSKLGQAKADVLDSHSQETWLSVPYIKYLNFSFF